MLVAAPRPNTELVVDYGGAHGRLSNGKLLLDYGFSLSRNPQPERLLLSALTALRPTGIGSATSSMETPRISASQPARDPADSEGDLAAFFIEPGQDLEPRIREALMLALPTLIDHLSSFPTPLADDLALSQPGQSHNAPPLLSQSPRGSCKDPAALRETHILRARAGERLALSWLVGYLHDGAWPHARIKAELAGVV